MERLLNIPTGSDPVLNQLEQIIQNKALQPKLRIENFGQSLEYLVENNKFTVYTQNTHMFQKLMAQIIVHNNHVGMIVNRLETRIEDVEKRGCNDIQEVMDQNEQLEAELENLEAQIDKLRVYEQSYHS